MRPRPTTTAIETHVAEMTVFVLMVATPVCLSSAEVPDRVTAEGAFEGWVGYVTGWACLRDRLGLSG